MLREKGFEFREVVLLTCCCVNRKERKRVEWVFGLNKRGGTWRESENGSGCWTVQAESGDEGQKGNLEREENEAMQF